jgi:hypothetical protein
MEKMLAGSYRLRGKRWAYRVFHGLKYGRPATAAVWQPPTQAGGGLAPGGPGVGAG